MTLKVAMRGGHNRQASGCSSEFMDEVTEDRKVLSSAIKYLQSGGASVLDVTPGPCDVNTDLAYGVNKANAWGADIFISIHFDKCYEHYDGDLGTGTWVYATGENAETYASRIVNSVSSLGFKNRGVKVNPKLYELRKTSMSAVITEVCFAEATGDMAVYNRVGYDLVGKKIAEGILGVSLNTTTTPVQQPKINESGYFNMVYQNGKTSEAIYSDSAFINKIGSLDPGESCKAMLIDNKVVVCYRCSSGLKVGFPKWQEGLQK